MTRIATALQAQVLRPDADAPARARGRVQLGLRGEVAAISEGREILARPGELIVKPRGEWHTFWKPGDEPAVLLEIISPAGLEKLFRSFAVGQPTPDSLATMGREYGCDVDFEATMKLAQTRELAM